MPDNKPKDPTADETKQLSKLLDSHVAVLAHKFKRPPSMEELTSFLSEDRQSDPVTAEPAEKSADPSQPATEGAPAQPNEPKILSYKLYFGMKNNEGKREFDPNKVLFYESGDGRIYDASTHEWCPSRPPIIDHLQSREMMFDENGHDIMAAIIHGVMDSEDFGSLDQADLLNDHHRDIWRLTEQLESQMSDLQKSLESEGDDIESTDSSEAPAESETPSEAQPETETSEAAPVDSGAQTSSDTEGDLAGDNVLEQIIAGAMAEAIDATLGDLEGKIRSIVQEEIRKMFGEGPPEEESEFQEFDPNT